MKLSYSIFRTKQGWPPGRLAGRFNPRHSIQAPKILNRSGRLTSTESHQEIDSTTQVMPSLVPQLEAPNSAYAKQRHHVGRVSHFLQQHGILKIKLGFQDPDSKYLEKLLMSLHEYQGHRLPISHSASRGWFWDVRPSNNTPTQTPQHQARSETMEEFVWHTDCSYETAPPRYFALHVLQHDRLGGGTLSVMNVQRLSELLSPETRQSLSQQEFVIKIPLEFIKSPERREIVGSLFSSEHDLQPCVMRFRRDLISPLTARASKALQELDMALQSSTFHTHSILQFPSEELPAGSIILLDNRRWLHERSVIKDQERHLRRVRWDPTPF